MEADNTMTTILKPRGTTENDITAEVLRRFDATGEPRLRQIMQSLVRHLHGFVKDVELTEAEWMTAIQFLTETGHITDERRQEFGELVENTIQQIEAGNFLPHSGIRFPQNPCTTCPYVGLCLGQQELVATLIRKPGDDLGWLDELNY